MDRSRVQAASSRDSLSRRVAAGQPPRERYDSGDSFDEYLSDGDLSRRSFLIVQPQLKQEEVSQRSHSSSDHTHSSNDHVLYVLYCTIETTLHSSLSIKRTTRALCFLFQYSYETQI